MKPLIPLATTAGLCLALALPAQSALFTASTSIGPTDTNYDGQDIVVIGCTLTIDGTHSFSDLAIIESGTVTHSPIASNGVGLNLTVTNNVVVEAGSAINANGLGYGPGLGAGAGSSSNDLEFGFVYTTGGGGGYGGYGGTSSGGAVGGASYGSLVAPTNAGSGGGKGFGSGGAGGGLVNLTIGGALVLDGLISANGANGVNLASGGGSGGSIFITAPSVSGDGSITAGGGMGESTDGGGGGGGRIALFFTTNDFTGTVSAAGGQGSVAGGAGTIDLQSESGFGDQIVVDNGGLSGTNTPLNGSVVLPYRCNLTISGGAIGYFMADGQPLSNLVVGSNSWLVAGSVLLPLVLNVVSNVLIEAGGGISMDAVVTSRTGNPGAIFQTNNLSFGGGGGGGGNGGAGFGAAGGAANTASALEPTAPGCVGGLGSGNSPYNAGGAGGGVIEMNVTGTLTLNGSISADGGAGIGDGSGGGSAGSVYLTLGYLAGTGAISANGGAAGSAEGGGGGGGRIAVSSEFVVATNKFSGTMSAAGGSGLVNGGAGTIYSHLGIATIAQLVVGNAGVAGAVTPVVEVGQEIDLTVTNGASLVGALQSIGTFHNLVVGPNSFLIQSNGSPNLNVSANATIAAGGGILVVANGLSTSPEEGGGSYGGYGGAGLAGISSGYNTPYGSLQNPSSVGTRGGSGPTGVAGGYGGGELQLAVSGTLLLNGTLSANGQSATVGSGAGGGSGGSIFVSSSGYFSGNGSITANAGTGDLPTGGGGAGGRIAILEYSSNAFTGSASAFGAPGYVGGGAGTIYISTNGSSFAQVIVDNGGTIGTNTPFTSSLPSCDLTVANGAIAAFSYNGIIVRNLLVTSNSFIVPNSTGSSGTVEMTVTSNATILPTCGIILDGKGYAAGTGGGYGYGQTTTSNNITTGGGGAGMAGVGGTSALGAAGGGPYYETLYLGDGAEIGEGDGGGSGMGISPKNLGGSGGGFLELTVTGVLTLGGKLSANGTTGPGEGSGGGGGGGIWVSAGMLTGNGNMTANGGAGQLPYGGGGGGGVIQVTSASNQYTGTITAHGGAGATAGGAGAVYGLLVRGGVGQVIIDNGGLSGTNTPFSGVEEVNQYDLTITNGAITVVSQYLNGTIRNLVIGSNSFFMVSTQSSYLNLNLAGNVTILPTGGIVLNGAETSNNSGSGAGRTATSGGSTSGSGAGYGGNGGASASGAPGGGTYGSVNNPNNLGSGGGNYASPANAGGLGGGAIELTTKGTLALGGKISANGTAGVTQGCGGGSGGSVWLNVGVLTGGGSITANGGAGQFQGGGGGGGGRIAVTAVTNLFTGVMAAQGGAGFANGGAGTVYAVTTSNSQSSTPQLIIDNGGLRATATALTASSLPSLSGTSLSIQNGAAADISSGTTIRSLFVGSNSFLVQTNPATLYLTVTSNATVQAGGGIILDGSGYGATGPGSGKTTLANFGFVTGSGGGHGGYGGNGESGAAGGNVYDQISEPLQMGSGGGAGAGVGATSAPGGGAVELVVTGKLQMDGLISANGAAPGSEAGGGGSGGSIYVITGVLAGAGTFSANGASGDLPNGGGGGGGRIALQFVNSNLFTGVLQARGGLGFVPGGAGTISVIGQKDAPSALIIDNGGLSGTNTPISAPSAYDVTITGGAVVVPQNPGSSLTLHSLLVESNAVLTHPSASGNVYLMISGNAVVQSNASISVDGKGYFPGKPGPGAGALATNDIGGGGGHGGMGGAGASGALGGNTNDSLQQPILWGSAGGVADTEDPNLSAGGGAIELTVAGTLTVNGTVSANGTAAVFPGAGGGAGGSIYLRLGTLAGNGLLSANGGAGHGSLGGGGGGGRIALYFQTNQFTGATNLSGGAGFAASQTGTLWLSTNQSPPLVQAAAPMPVAVSVAVDPPSGNLILQWCGAGGVACQVQASTDLIHWQPYGGAMVSSNGPNALALPVGSDPGTFFRLVPAW